MISLAQLWLPILLSAALAFIASALLWTVVGHHNKDWKGLPDEVGAANALRGAAPGMYMIPYAGSGEAMRDPEFIRRREAGPYAIITIGQSGAFSMGPKLVQTFVFYLVISLFVAYIASRTLPPGTEYLQVFRVTGTVAFLAHAAANVHYSIWFSRPWSATMKDVFDALVYALLIAGVFGWQWPGA